MISDVPQTSNRWLFGALFTSMRLISEICADYDGLREKRAPMPNGDVGTACPLCLGRLPVSQAWTGMNVIGR